MWHQQNILRYTSLRQEPRTFLVSVCVSCARFLEKIKWFFFHWLVVVFFKCISNTKGEKIPTIKTTKEIRVLPEPPEGTQSCQPLSTSDL